MIGIYKITNKSNSKVYVGQSKSIGVRWNGHINRLECNKHDNRNLQEDYNIYGYNNFIFEIVEECNEGDLLFLEKEYIDKHINNCYNILRNGKQEIIQKHNNHATDFKFDKAIAKDNILSISIKAQRIILMAYNEFYITNDNYIEISATDVKKCFNISASAFYRDCRKIKEELEQTNVFKSIDLYESNLFILSFNDDFINTGSYITNDLINYIKNFKNKRTLKILLDFIIENKNLYYEVDKIRETLKLKGKAYDKFSSITSKVLTPVINDINNNTDIKIEYSYKKRLRNIVGIQFSETIK